MVPTFILSNNFWTKTCFGPKFFSDHNFLDSKYFGSNFFYHNFFWTCTIFWTENSFAPSFFSWILSEPKILSWTRYLSYQPKLSKTTISYHANATHNGNNNNTDKNIDNTRQRNTQQGGKHFTLYFHIYSPFRLKHQVVLTLIFIF